MKKNTDDVEIVEKTVAFQGYFRVDRYLLKHRLHEGGWSDVMSREVFERGHVAGVMPYDPERDELVFIEQFRPGAYAAALSPDADETLSPWIMEFVAGVIDANETPEDVVIREAREEAGLEIESLMPIAKYLSTPGACSEFVHVYCGRVNATGAGGIHGLDHEHEDIRVIPVPVDEAFKWLEEGRIVNSKALIALQWFHINRDRVRRAWGFD